MASLKPSQSAVQTPGKSDTPGRSDFMPELGTRSLAHELNSLLDGSMRSIDLARKALLKSESSLSIEHRLELAHEAMMSMATMLERAMVDPDRGLETFASTRTLEQETVRAIATLKPLLEEHDIHIMRSLTEQAGRTAAGMLGVVLANGLRNAMDAIIRGQMPGGVVTMTASIEGDHQLVIGITDNGPGIRTQSRTSIKPTGHGIGLELSRLIVKRMGGTLNLHDAPTGRGAILDIRIPLEQPARP